MIQSGSGEFTNANAEAVSFTLEDIVVEKVSKESFAFKWNSEFTVTLDTALTEELLQEGMARELIRAVQYYRKHLNSLINAQGAIMLSADSVLEEVITEFQPMLAENLLMLIFELKSQIEEGKEIKIEDYAATIQLIAVN